MALITTFNLNVKMNSMDHIKELVDNKFSRLKPTCEDWNKLELELGVELPSECNELISYVGDGWFGEIVFFNPVKGSYLTFTKSFQLEQLDLFRYDVKGSNMALYPDSNGYLLIGGVSGAGGIFCRRESNNNWSYVYLEGGFEECYNLETGLLNFLLNLYKKQNLNHDWQIELSDFLWHDQSELFLNMDDKKKRL